MGFWGSSKAPESTSPTTSSDFAPEAPAASTSSFTPSNSSNPKLAVMQQIQQEAAVANARALIDKLNEHCFERCVPKPGTSLSSTEQTCFSMCMEKYTAAWGAVSQAYVSRLQSEGGA